VHTVVANRITVSVPVEEVVADIERDTPAIFAGRDGFVGLTLVKTGPQELVVIGDWASPKAAAAGAAVWPGPFKTWVAPRSSGRGRTAGDVASDIGWGSRATVRPGSGVPPASDSLPGSRRSASV
jgi:hypothetical protein